MDEYITILICRALINIAGDLAVEINEDTDAIVEKSIADAALQIECFSNEAVKASIQVHNPRLFTKAFTQKNGVKPL